MFRQSTDRNNSPIRITERRTVENALGYTLVDGIVREEIYITLQLLFKRAVDSRQ